MDTPAPFDTRPRPRRSTHRLPRFLLLAAALLGFVGCGEKAASDPLLSKRVGATAHCYERVMAAITKQDLKDKGVQIQHDSVKRTMEQYVDQACKLAPPRKPIGKVRDYAINLAAMTQERF